VDQDPGRSADEQRREDGPATNPQILQRVMERDADREAAD
jgi:hypothetical protein